MPSPNPSSPSEAVPDVFETFARACAERVNAALQKVLPDAGILPQRLHAAMRHATFNGGKRVRPLLVYATGQACGVSLDILDPAACAVELIHSYSLVHDDLPAMDDDDLRRGQPTCHRAFDEATAILAGDALQSLAFEILARPGAAPDPKRQLDMIHTLAAASGSRGMAGGQALDIQAVGTTLSLPELENMHIHKTGALIRASVRLATLAAGAPQPLAERLDHYAKAVGLAFQVQDDILDVVGDSATLGKTQGKDQATDKPTYTSLLGIEGARRQAQRLIDEAMKSLSAMGPEADQLRHLAQYVVRRGY